jgi:hypothetical protein
MNCWRISGNTSFVSRGDWGRLLEYETALHNRIQDRQIVACCSYHRHQCDAIDVLEVAHVHTAALDRIGDDWQVFTKMRGA